MFLVKKLNPFVHYRIKDMYKFYTLSLFSEFGNREIRKSLQKLCLQFIQTLRLKQLFIGFQK